MTAIVQNLVTSGTFQLDGGSWDVDNNVWIVGDDAEAIVIDAAHDAKAIANVVGERKLAAIVCTHAHNDHVNAAPALAAATGAPVFALRPAGGANALRDGQPVEGGGVRLVAVRTPGHSSDHVAFRVAGGDGIFTGDAVLGRGTSVIDPPDGDLVAYLRSLRRLLELRPRTLYPGHGPLVLDGSARIEGYLAHRDERERQVLAALVRGARTIEEIVAVVYPDERPEIQAVAARSVLAHLRKLEAEGRAGRVSRSDPVAYTLLDARACARCGRTVRSRGELCDACRVSALQEGPRPEGR
jgi:glyoxylase-like metal-dependent hydrolase (beta-lactamase superfamily II)